MAESTEGERQQALAKLIEAAEKVDAEQRPAVVEQVQRLCNGEVAPAARRAVIRSVVAGLSSGHNVATNGVSVSNGVLLINLKDEASRPAAEPLFANLAVIAAMDLDVAVAGVINAQEHAGPGLA